MSCIPTFIFEYVRDYSIKLLGQDEGRGGQKISVFVYSQGITTVHARRGGVKKWQNSVHIVVECPLRSKLPNQGDFLAKHWTFLEIVCRASPVVF